MAETTATAKASQEAAENRVIEMTEQKAPQTKLLPEETGTKKPRAGVLHQLGRLKPLLPVLSGGLRMIDHGAVQALAQLLSLVNGGTVQPPVDEELHQGLAEVQASHRELHLQVQDQTMEMKRIEEQVTLLRHAVERNATEHAELAENVKSLGNLVRTVGAGLAILLIVLIALTVLLLAGHR